MSRINLFLEALEQDPDNELARFSLATELLEEERFEEALLHFEKALESNPQWMVVHLRKGQCLLELGRPEEARASLVRSRELMFQMNDLENLEEVDTLLAETDQASQD
jgi:tetratricopeptide (TPR) repeat protein